MQRFLLFSGIIVFFVLLFVVPVNNGETVFEMVKSDQAFWGTLTEVEPIEEVAIPYEEKVKKEVSPVGSGEIQEKNIAFVEEKKWKDQEGAFGEGENKRPVLGGETKDEEGPSEDISAVTSYGVLKWTNYYRAQYGKDPLSMNPRLVASAKLKVGDMFRGQYFKHKSPSGKGVADLARQVGYEYIMVGENLALGDFFSSKDLVDAWMDSPHHRENILNKSYEEIGIAVRYGMYDGDMVWLSAQEFGRPRSACPEPSDDLQEKIALEKVEVKEMVENLETMREELESMDESDTEEYNQQVEAYNDLVREVNEVNKELKDLIEKYNQQVKDFNTCVNK